MILLLDGREIDSREKLHRLIREQLDPPDYYGDNLDALWDLLSSEPEELSIRLVHRKALLENIGDYGESLLELLLDLSDQNPEITLEIS